MARCEVCNNDYDATFEVVMQGKHHTFDSFECAIHALAPRCGACGCRIVGHGVQKKDTIYCCAACAEAAGESEFRDRA